MKTQFQQNTQTPNISTQHTPTTNKQNQQNTPTQATQLSIALITNNVNMVNVNKRDCEKVDKEYLDSLGIVLINICALTSKLKQYELKEFIQN